MNISAFNSLLKIFVARYSVSPLSRGTAMTRILISSGSIAARLLIRFKHDYDRNKIEMTPGDGVYGSKKSPHSLLSYTGGSFFTFQYSFAAMLFYCFSLFSDFMSFLASSICLSVTFSMVFAISSVPPFFKKVCIASKMPSLRPSFNPSW